MVLFAPVLLGVGTLLGKYFVLAYNEEYIAEKLGKLKQLTEGFPEHRKNFWNKKIDGLIETMPKKKTTDDIQQYSKEELQHYAGMLGNFLKSLLEDAKKNGEGVRRKIQDEIDTIVADMKKKATEKAGEVGNQMAATAIGAFRALTQPKDSGNKDD